MAIIDNLPSLTALAATDEFAVERGTTTYKTTYDAIVGPLNLYFAVNDTSWSAIYNIVSKIPNNSMAFFVATTEPASVLSNGKLNFVIKGMVARTNNIYDFIVYTGYQPQYIWVWRISDFTSASVTPTVSAVSVLTSSTTKTAYTPTISCSGNTTFAADNVSFNYFVTGNTLRVVGRFSIANIGDGTGGIRISLPSNMSAMAMGVGSVGYYDAGNQVEHGFIRTVSANSTSTEVMLYYNAGGTATTPARLGAGTYVSIDFTVYLS